MEFEWDPIFVEEVPVPCRRVVFRIVRFLLVHFWRLMIIGLGSLLK